MQTSGATAPRVDLWLSRTEEEQLYQKIAPEVIEVAACLQINDKWNAFLIVHNRYNPALPPWFRGPVELLEFRLQEKFSELRLHFKGAPAKRIERGQEAALGIARHLASMTIFSADCTAGGMTELALKRAGVAFFTRTAPEIAENALNHYKGADVTERMDAILCTEMLAMLCAVVGWQPSINSIKLDRHFRFEPYYAKFVERSPDRRSCAQLAASVYNFREHAFDSVPGRIFKPIEEKPVPILPTKGAADNSKPQASGSHKAKSWQKLPVKEPASNGDEAPPAPHFSMESLQEMAGERGGPEKYPATMTLSWFAGRVKEFAIAGEVFYVTSFTYSKVQF